VLLASHFCQAEEVRRPTFVIGCPRSGTTHFGRLLAAHPDILYLNEPKWLWARICPRWDSYGAIHSPRQASIELPADDATAIVKRRVRRAFHYIQTLSNASVIVEKTPDNGARIQWLNAIFPDAQFIHLLRDPHDTAVSLSKALGKWFPAGWHQSPQYRVWQRHCQRDAELAGLWASARNDYERSLIVWREINRLATTEGTALGPHRYFVLRYESLVREPRIQMAEVMSSLQLAVTDDYLGHVEGLTHAGSVCRSDRDDASLVRFVGRGLLERLAYRDKPAA
jgi:hypothetical protein